MKSVLTFLIFLSVIVTVNSNPTADAGPDHTICLGDNVTLGDGLGMGYTYEWSPTQNLDNPFTHHPVARPTITTTYILTVTDDHGCTDTDDIVVTVVPRTTASFTYTPDQPVCAKDTIYFTNTSVSHFANATYHWDFGDGTTSDDENPFHIYTSGGSYYVIMTVSDDCGLISACESFNIVPTSPAYNFECCSEDPTIINYTYDNISITNPISSPMQWTSTYPNLDGKIYIKGTLTIEENSELIIEQDVNVQFSPLGKIIIKRGGILILDGAILSGIEPDYPVKCNTMWQGIEVWGNSSKTHFVSDIDYQGKLAMKNGATIKNAHNAVLLGRPIICHACPNVYCPYPPCLIPVCSSRIPYNINYGGGIVNAHNSNFYNNAVSIKFTPYEYTNVSEIESCNFKGGYLLDPGYDIDNFYTYPNNANRLYAKANDHGRSCVGIYQWQVRDVSVKSNYFYDIETGIEAHNALCFIGGSISGEGNLFKNLTYGFRAFNTTNSLYSAQYIAGNEFRNIAETAISEYSGVSSRIEKNEFKNNNPSQDDYLHGIYLENSSGFEILDNQFERLKYGIIVNNSALESGDGSGTVRAENGPPYNGNIFNSCKYGVYTYNNNSFLEIKCNRHNPSYTEEYEVNWLNQGPLADQGECTTDHHDMAGNEFDPNFPYSTKKQIQTSWLFVPPNSHAMFFYDYYRHSKSAQGTQSVTPEPIPVLQWFGIGVYNTGIPKLSSPDEYSCAPGSKKTLNFLQDKSNEIAALETEYDSFESTLDGGGYTDVLLSAINSNISNGHLKDMLTDASPLSDTVLTEIINRTNPLPPGHFKQVIIPNSPVSDKIKPCLNNKLEELPPGIANQIRNVQVINPNYMTLTIIQREIDRAKLERKLALNSIIIDTLQQDSVNAVINLLETENTVIANKILAGTFLSDNNLSAAQDKINSLPGNTQEEQDWIELQNIILHLTLDTNTIFETDSAQEQFIRSLAYQIPESPATSNAKSILRLVYWEDFPIQFPSCEGDLKTIQFNDEQDNNNISEQKHIYLGKNYPDPFDNYTNIPYYVPDESKNVFIKVYNVKGNFIKKYRLNKGNNILKIYTSDWAKGIYFYCIEINGTILEYNKMALIK